MKKLFVKIKWSLLGMFLPALTLAQITSAPRITTVPSDLESTISNIINVVISVVGLIAIVVIVIGGIKIITSGGDDEAKKSGTNFITYGIIGLVVVILAYAIVSFIITRIR